MAKRDSYEDDDDFLDEEIADWDDDELDDEEDDVDDQAEDVDDDDDEEDEDDDVEDDADDSVEQQDDAPAPVTAKRSQKTKASDVAEEADEAPPEEPEEEIDYPPDDEKALAALRKLRVRLDVNEKGNVWRAIFDDTNGKDPALVLLKGLPALKELWLLGTKVTQPAAEAFKADHPKIKVYF